MNLLLILVTIAVILRATFTSYYRGKDPLVPMVIFCPMLLYVYGYSPLSMEFSGLWKRYPILDDHLGLIGLVNLLTISAFCLGAVPSSRAAQLPESRLLRPLDLTPELRRGLYIAGLFLGFLAAAAFWYMVHRSGGFARVFSHGKPFIAGGSGYIGELPNLVMPAIVLLALAWQGQRLRLSRLLIILFIASPHLMMGFLGGRRGPAFLILLTLACFYFLVRLKRPSLQFVFVGLLGLGIAMFFLLTQRDKIFLGSNFNFDLTETVTEIRGSSVSDGHQSVVAAAGIVVASNEDRHFWGARYLVTLLVRPIPRQVWPTKYEDMGMGWMQTMPGSFGFSPDEWRHNVGFVPHGGNSPGFVTDLFIEFSYFGFIGAFFIGKFYRVAWERSRLVGGAWSVFYFLMLSLSVYLPSQTIQAWLVRLLIGGLPTLLLWHFVIRRLHWQSVSSPRRAIL